LDERRIEISIVIPVLGRYGELERVLDRLDHQRCEPDSFEVLVVCDAAEPHPQRVSAAIGSRGYAIRQLRGPQPGAAWARDVGWSQASAALVLFLDSDVLPEARLVEQHLEWHHRSPQPEVAVLGRVRWARGLPVTAFMRWIERGIQFDFDRIDGTEAGWERLYTANVSVKREMLEVVGGFEAERFPFHYEDLDLAYRMHEKGLRLLYNRAAVGEHLHAVTLESYRRRMAEIAPVERRFVHTHPEVKPYFYELFRRADGLPTARGRSARLVRWVPPDLPWLGPLVWRSADHYFAQRLAPAFLSAWDATSSGVSSPGGPK
jgi:GT2 family glycosyltransferase